MNNLSDIAERLRIELSAKNSARDETLNRSRELIRHCAECIRAIHRREWETAEHKFNLIRQAADDLRNGVIDHPDLYYTGYSQDALKEVVEAYATYAIIRNQPLPTPAELNVPAATYLNGLAEAATELRRFILDIMRREEAHSASAEALLDWMDAIYDQLITFDFPDAITNNLRRQTDIVRGVLERTRGDMTQSLRQQQLQTALARVETLLNETKGDG